jgi:vitamin B12 transporter
MKTTAGVSLFLGFLLCLSFVSPAISQTPGGDAHLSGALSDPSGAPLAKVKVTAQAEPPGSAKPFTAVSASDGSYSLTLPAGRYMVRFSGESFSQKQVELTLAPGENHALNQELALSPLSDHVIVTAQSVPTPEQQTAAPTDTVSREEMEQRQSVAIIDALQYAPGIAIGRTGAMGGTASLFLDGGNSNYTKVLVDGTSINPAGGAVDFSILTTDNIEKVEIVHGAESAFYGTDAVSGVVQLFTRRGTTETPTVSVFAEGGDYASGRGGVQLSGLLGKFDYSAAASYLSTDGQGPNDAFINRTLSGIFGYSFSDTNQIHLSLRNNTSDAGIPGQTVYTPPSLYQKYNQELFSANLRWDFSSGEHWHYMAAGTESYTRQHSFNPQQSFYATDPNAFCPQTSPTAVATGEFCDYTYDSLYSYNRAGFEGQGSYLLRNFVFTAGYQYEVENAGLNFLEQGHVRRNNQGGYLDLRYSPISRLSLDAAVRAEDNGYFGTRVVPRVGGSLALRYGKGFWGDTRYRAFYGEGIKEPRFDQTYGTDPCDPGNLTLKPESSKTWSTGVDQKLADDRVKVSADYFSNRYYDIVSFEFCSEFAPCPGVPPPGCPFGYGTYFNTDRARARGTHVVAEVQATKWLFVRGNYTYDDSLIISSPNATDPSLIPGNRLARRPVNSGSISFFGTYHRFTGVFAVYSTGQRTDSDFLGLGYTRNPGYTRFDLSGSYAFQHGFMLYARCTNLLNKFYQDALGYPALGRSAQVGVRYTLAGHD